MRINDIPLEVLPTHHSKSLQINNSAAHRAIFGSSSGADSKSSLRKSIRASRSGVVMTNDPPTKALENQRFHIILDRLKLLSIISPPSVPPLSLENIAKSLLENIYLEYQRLRKLDLIYLKEAYELFKSYEYGMCLIEYQKGYQMSCLIDFIEREYWEDIKDGVIKERNQKKTLIEKLEEEREEMKLICKLSYLLFYFSLHPHTIHHSHTTTIHTTTLNSFPFFYIFFL
jgi:hypothetical protein